jgi:PAS domain S-box-containing protein
MFALSLAPFLAFFVITLAGAWIAQRHVAGLITGSMRKLELEIERHAIKDAELQIQARARDIAGEIEAILNSHRGVTMGQMQQSEVVRRVAVQRVGLSGYSCLYEAETGIIRFHPNADLIDKPLSLLAEKLPSFWKIFEPSLAGVETAGFYDWIDPDGRTTYKYMVMTPVGVPFEGKTLMVAATIYIDEFLAHSAFTRDQRAAIEHEYSDFVKRQIFLSVLTVCVILTLTLLVIALLNGRAARRLVQPFRELLGAVEKFGKDPFKAGDPPPFLERRDEIGELARTYDRMRLHIADQIRRLRQALVRLREMKTEIAASEERFRKAFEEASIGMTLVSTEGVYLDVNLAFCAILGTRPKELIGKAAVEISHEDDLEERKRYIDDLLSGRRSSVQQVRRLIRHDGEIVWVQVSSSLRRDEKGNPLHFISLVQDITEKKKAEDELQLARFCIDHAATGIFRIDDDGRILEANEHACRMLGYRREELLRLKVLDLDPAFSTPEDFAAFRRKLRRERPIVIDRKLRRKDGTQIPVEIAVSFFVREGQEFSYAFVSDVSERLKVEAKRRKLEAQLQQAQKMEAIGTLAGGVAHDFNNILAVIIGSVNLLELSESLSAADRNSVAQILAASTRARELIKQILAFSRRGVQEKNLVNLKPVVKETVQFLKSTLPSTIEVRQNMASDSPAILADPTQMQQVLMNLCTNAAHALEETESGTIEIRLEPAHLSAQDLRFQPDVEPGLFVHLAVADSGCGIPPEHCERIFDPYFTTKPSGKGTGLGLAVVHGIVQNHDGFIRVESTPGQGTVFHLFLPAAESLASAADTVHGPSASQLPRGSGVVLFVDDEPVLVEIGSRMLAHLGYSPEPRTSPLEALAAFRANPEKFTAVVTDMTMPHMNGLSLSRRILEIRPDTPIVLCTGFSEKASEEKAAAAGVRVFLQKPLTLADLAGALKGILETRMPQEITP